MVVRARFWALVLAGLLAAGVADEAFARGERPATPLDGQRIGGDPVPEPGSQADPEEPMGPERVAAPGTAIGSAGDLRTPGRSFELLMRIMRAQFVRWLGY